jgi:antitoxin HigA-1
MAMKRPVHPGEIVRGEIEYLGLSIAEAAQGLGVTRQHLYRIVNGESGVSAEMAIRLELGIGSTADAWLRMQAAYDLAQIRNRADRAIQVSKLPSKSSEA